MNGRESTLSFRLRVAIGAVVWGCVFHTSIEGGELVPHVCIVVGGEVREHAESDGVGFGWVELSYVHSTSQVLFGCGWHRHSIAVAVGINITREEMWTIVRGLRVLISYVDLFVDGFWEVRLRIADFSWVLSTDDLIDSLVGS